jgi:hypothetical protein
VLRSGSHPDAGGLAIAADSEHARRIAKLIREVTGASPVMVLHQEARAAEKLADFTRSTDPWIVAVNMVSEGVDIPRLRVGVYSTAAKTPLIFRQIVGRFVRTIPGRPPEPSWLYVPADPVLRDHAARVEQELRSFLRRREPGEDLAELDEAPRRETERTEAPDFEPLLADVAPQMTLFGSPPTQDSHLTAMAAAPAAAHVPPSAPRAPLTSVPTPEPVPAPEPAEPASIPAFERRRQMRAQRHRLVSDLARVEKLGQRDVNAWINRELGIPSVEKATLPQLERSIEWLERKLARGKRR